MSKVVDLYNESEMLEEINPEDLIMEEAEKVKENEGKDEKQGKGKKKR